MESSSLPVQKRSNRQPVCSHEPQTWQDRPVGVVNLELNRAEWYHKELSFQVSCSYGPGRYDPDYEERGNDYPLPFVRWTEQRNIAAILDLLERGKLKRR